MNGEFKKAVDTFCKNTFNTKQNAVLNENSFFNIWFREFGTPYTFIFKKNLKVTNIQFAELISLIRYYSKTKENDTIEIQFLTVKEYIEKFTLLFKTFFSKEIYKNKNDYKATLENFVLLYKGLFESIVAVDTFYGTCGIFLPHNISIDLEKVCFNSGYIHSCGQNLYTRKIYKAKEDEFFNRLHTFLQKNPSIKKIPFTLYSHEDFTPYDRGEGNDFFKDGLDELKFYVEKLYMGDVPMSRLLNDLKNDTKFKKLDISLPGDYHENIKGLNDKSIWLINDRSIDLSAPKPGPYKYFVCYVQQIINENPFHLFDENKPGWIDHVTIPHTLMGAMINLGICNKLNNKTKLKVFDPFIGSGTTLFELAKSENFEFEGSDSSPLVSLVVNDNIDFFLKSRHELEQMERDFSKIQLLLLYSQIKDKTIKTAERKKLQREFEIVKEFLYPKQKVIRITTLSNSALSKAFTTVIKSLNRLIKAKSFRDDKKVKQLITKYTEYDRLFFYIGLKALKRYDNAIFERQSIESTIAYINELDEFILRLRNYKKLKIRLENKQKGIDGDIDGNCYKLYLGNFSKAISFKVKRLNAISSNFVLENEKDVIIKLNDLSAEGKKFDLIVTDPPYGFNTDESIIEFSNIFYKMLEGLIKCLTDFGQIVICLPEWSHTGRKVLFFTQRQIIIHQLLAFASKHNMELISPYKLIPKPNWLFQPPYYWESEKALKRSILHFAFRKR